MSETSNSSDENYAVLVTNQSYDTPSNSLVGDPIEDPRNTAAPNEEDVRSEALIKKIHPFVFPKQFNTFGGLPNRGFNATDEPHMMEVKGLEHPSNERIDERFSPIDQKHPNGNGDLIPMSTHIFERPAKHAHFNHGFLDRPHSHHQVFQSGNNCLLGMLNGCDPLVLMGILGFLAYVINTVLSLVNRINLPLLTPVTATEMTAAAAAAAAATRASLTRQGIGVDDQTTESNQRLLKDFERILQMAIEIYEQRVNTN